MHPLSKREYRALGGAAALLLPALLLNLNLVPLYGEEPRRAVVAMEMLFRHNWLVPTVNGEYYYLKPPFFNWILASLYQLTGTFSEFVTRLPSVISLLLTGFVIFVTGKKYVSRDFGALSAMLFLTASGNLFYNSLLAEIDLFYSLVTFSGLVCLFHFQRLKKHYWMFITVYLLGAAGVLTKGAPSLVYTGISLIVWLGIQRELRKLFSIPHLAGLFLFILVVGGYFYLYSREGNAIVFLRSLSFESGKRFSGDSIWEYVLQLARFPLDTLLNLLPASLLLVFAFRKSFLKVITANPLITFSAVMLAVHFPVYWLPPGGRQRYIIMLYPFIIQILAYFYLEFLSGERKSSGYLGFLAKIPRSAIIYLIILMIAGRIVFDLAVLPVRASEGKSADNRKAAYMLQDIIKEEGVCVFRSTYFPMQCTYYMERKRKEIVPRCRDAVEGKYIIVQKILLSNYEVRRDIGALMANPLRPCSDPYSGDDTDLFSGYKYETILEFTLQKRPYLLVIPVRPHP